jgi:uncharacterized protein (DUF1800 family)
MKKFGPGQRIARSKFALPAALLCAIALLCAATLAARTASKSSDYGQFHQKLSKDQQVLHILDRLTFGPRPGDVEQVKKFCVKNWIDLQLHPERIAEPASLDARLAPLESLRIGQAEAVAKYPTPQAIRAVALGTQPPPEDPIARAAIERIIRRQRIRKDLPENTPPEPVKPLEQVFSPDQIRTLRNGSPDQRHALLRAIPEEQVDDAIIAMPQGLRQQLLAVADPMMRRKLVVANTPQQVIAYDLTESKVYRAIYSNRQLEEELVDFWYNHFNVYLDQGADRILVPTYERDSIRPYVLGKFRDMLGATAISPAMLFYLDNWQSVVPEVPKPNAKKHRAVRGLNENYARELMELHTLGVDGGYTQQDIIEVARCFTGWTIRQPNQGGGFFFNDKVHDKGEKTVLGVTIPAGGGQDDGEKVLDILAAHASTARFISKKLAQRFVADDPPPELLDQMAMTFQNSGGDIRAVMETMLYSKEFLSVGAYHAKMKTPFDMIVSAVRATNAQVDYAAPLVNQIAQLGEPLYRKLEPTGYPSANADWMNSASLLARMNFALQLAQNKIQGVKVETARFSPKPQETARQVLFFAPSSQTMSTIDKAAGLQAGKGGAAPTRKASPAMIAGLVIGSPEFQRR